MFGIVGSMASISSLLFSVVGVVISFLSLSSLGVWVGMELSFLSVLCFASGSSVDETESIMKYYVVQVLGSCICAMGFLFSVNFLEAVLGQFLILVGMLVKLGVFPFHFWVAPVVGKLSWAGCASILLLQKLVPLWVLSNYIVLFKDLSRVEFLCCMTSLVGCLGGLNVLNYRVLLGFSSIQNLGPLILLCCCYEFGLWMYILIYFISTSFLMSSLWQLGIYSFQDMMKSGGIEDLWWVSLYFLSSAGLPPFLGCALKVVLLGGCWGFMPIGTGFCVMTSCISLVFYLSVVLSMVVFWGKSSSFFLKGKYSFLSVVSLLVNLVGGFIVFLVVSL
uniref:NADH-ubiquinone oxidoreductase chain 2 n=1 Tax=Paratapes undulatus TaxID=2602928 RepID=H6BHU8_9BIVA|nr:NADH dehydrogenase subunit 2 [Paratapes undulatus]AEH99639.1 NADH dehydrogenase subunit 2 [Paratapes undulatus]